MGRMSLKSGATVEGPACFISAPGQGMQMPLSMKPSREALAGSLRNVFARRSRPGPRRACEIAKPLSGLLAQALVIFAFFENRDAFR